VEFISENICETATFRLRDTVKANFVLDIIREFFSETGFKFEDPEQVKILSGQEEGTNAWISANYFLNKFRPVSVYLCFY
jgi:Golgi nucleoside diphosphatase